LMVPPSQASRERGTGPLGRCRLGRWGFLVLGSGISVLGSRFSEGRRWALGELVLGARGGRRWVLDVWKSWSGGGLFQVTSSLRSHPPPLMVPPSQASRERGTGPLGRCRLGRWGFLVLGSGISVLGGDAWVGWVPRSDWLSATRSGDYTLRVAGVGSRLPVARRGWECFLRAIGCPPRGVAITRCAWPELVRGYRWRGVVGIRSSERMALRHEEWRLHAARGRSWFAVTGGDAWVGFVLALRHEEWRLHAARGRKWLAVSGEPGTEYRARLRGGVSNPVCELLVAAC
jgi:hypothetical protein